MQVLEAQGAQDAVYRGLAGLGWRGRALLTPLPSGGGGKTAMDDVHDGSPKAGATAQIQEQHA